MNKSENVNCGNLVEEFKQGNAKIRIYDSAYAGKSKEDIDKILKRIATIMVELRNGVPMMVILDEMLKGTNSEDKLKGSQKLVYQLAQTKAATIIAAIPGTPIWWLWGI